VRPEKEMSGRPQSDENCCNAFIPIVSDICLCCYSARIEGKLESGCARSFLAQSLRNKMKEKAMLVRFILQISDKVSAGAVFHVCYPLFLIHIVQV
jgi:hypothetical protein